MTPAEKPTVEEAIHHFEVAVLHMRPIDPTPVMLAAGEVGDARALLLATIAAAREEAAKEARRKAIEECIEKAKDRGEAQAYALKAFAIEQSDFDFSKGGKHVAGLIEADLDALLRGAP